MLISFFLRSKCSNRSGQFVLVILHFEDGTFCGDSWIGELHVYMILYILYRRVSVKSKNIPPPELCQVQNHLIIKCLILMRLKKRLFVIQGMNYLKKVPGDLLSVFKAGEGPWKKHLIKRNMQLGRPQAIIRTEDPLGWDVYTGPTGKLLAGICCTVDLIANKRVSRRGIFPSGLQLGRGLNRRISKTAKRVQQFRPGFGSDADWNILCRGLLWVQGLKLSCSPQR